MSEADRLKEDIQRMMQGLPRRGTADVEQNDEDNEDYEESLSDVKGNIAEHIKGIIEATITEDSIKKFCEAQEGVTNKLGQLGIGRIASELRSELMDAINNNFPEDQ